LEWLAGSLESSDPEDGAIEAVAYLLDFGLSFARFFYLGWHPVADAASWLTRLYAAYIRRILTAALSVSGRFQGEPTGYFVAAGTTHRDQCRDCLVNRRLQGRLLYHICELQAFGWEKPAQALHEIRNILAGLEWVLGSTLESDDGAVRRAEELAADNANILIVATSRDAIHASISALRSLETAEAVAERRFRPLLRLRNATRRCIEITRRIAGFRAQKRALLRPSTHWRTKQEQQDRSSRLDAEILSLTASLLEAEGERKTLQDECARGEHKDDLLKYESFYRRGEWRFVEYLATPGEPYCPLNQERLPTVVASQLSDITQPVKCPRCGVLIIPFPEGALNVC
jgi:hypothetical protein